MQQNDPGKNSENKIFLNYILFFLILTLKAFENFKLKNFGQEYCAIFLNFEELCNSFTYTHNSVPEQMLNNNL